MTDSSLSQVEADAPMALEKSRVDSAEWTYPESGGGLSIQLVSTDRRELFVLDIRRSRIDLAKGTYQRRARQVVVRARFDFGGSPHRNPEGNLVSSPHLHLYREGYGDKSAFPVPSYRFADPNDAWQTLADFMRFCNIVDPPIVRRGLFT